MVVKNLFGLLITFYLTGSLACTVPSNDSYLPVNELLEKSHVIALATATGIDFDEKGQTVSFEVKELIYSNDKLNENQVAVNLNFPESLNNDIRTYFTDDDQRLEIDFNSHHDEQFWLSSGGRAKVSPSCMVTPIFKKDSVYLLVLTQEPHVKGFELIKSNDDKWLTFVKNWVKSHKYN